MTAETAEVLVLGAGLSGAALAARLARSGYGRVVVVDPRTPAAGATGRAAGIVTEQLWDRWDVEVVRESRDEYARLAARHDPSAYRVNGFVRWTTRPEVVPVLDAATERLRGWGVEVRAVSSSDLAARLPWARCDDLAGGSFAPHDAVVAPSRLAELLIEEARSAGAEIALGIAPERFGREGGRWTVHVGSQVFRAPAAVVAAGAWSKRLLTSIGAPLPLAPYRTQAALLRPDPPVPEDLPSFHDLDLDVYGRPEEAGRVLVGDGTDPGEADPETFSPSGDERFLTHLAESFASRLPVWREAEMVRAWAGVCVATPDRRPLIGPVPEAPGLWVITGFNGFGVMRAAGAARRLAEALREPDRGSVVLGPVLPERFREPPGPFAPRPGFTLEGGTDPRF